MSTTLYFEANKFDAPEVPAVGRVLERLGLDCKFSCAADLGQSEIYRLTFSDAADAATFRLAFPFPTLDRAGFDQQIEMILKQRKKELEEARRERAGAGR